MEILNNITTKDIHEFLAITAGIIAAESLKYLVVKIAIKIDSLWKSPLDVKDE